MTELIVGIFWFLLGMGLSVQWVAALFGVIDYRYALPEHAPRVVGRIAAWSGVVGAAAWMAGHDHRAAFLWGAAVFPVMHLATWAGGKAFFTVRSRLP